MKRIITGVFLGVVLCFFGGCSRMTDIEDRDYAMVLGVDYQENQYVFTVSVADLTGYKGEVGETVGAKVYTVKADSFVEMIEIYNENNPKVFDYGHVKVLFLGDSLWENRESLSGFINELEENAGFAKTVTVCRGERVQDIVKQDQTMEMSLADYIDGILDNNEEEKTTLQDVILEINREAME